MTKKLLLLGANGQVGSACKYLLARRDETSLTPERGRLDLSDSRTVRAYLALERPDVIINAAAFTAVDQAEDEVALCYALNRDLPEELARYCADAGAKLIHYSTDYVFSGDGADSFTESDETKPLNVYGQSKLAGEMAITETCKDYCILRTSWVLSHNRTNFVTKILSKARETPIIRVVDDQVGSPTSSTYIASSTMRCIDLDLTGTYHLACAGYASWANVAEEVMEQARKHGTIGLSDGAEVIRVHSDEYKTIAMRPLNSKLNCEKWKSASGIRPPCWKDEVHDIVAKISDAGF